MKVHSARSGQAWRPRQASAAPGKSRGKPTRRVATMIDTRAGHSVPWCNRVELERPSGSLGRAPCCPPGTRARPRHRGPAIAGQSRRRFERSGASRARVRRGPSLCGPRAPRRGGPGISRWAFHPIARRAGPGASSGRSPTPGRSRGRPWRATRRCAHSASTPSRSSTRRPFARPRPWPSTRANGGSRANRIRRRTQRSCSRRKRPSTSASTRARACSSSLPTFSSSRSMSTGRTKEPSCSACAATSPPGSRAGAALRVDTVVQHGHLHTAVELHRSA